MISTTGKSRSPLSRLFSAHSNRVNGRGRNSLPVISGLLVSATLLGLAGCASSGGTAPSATVAQRSNSAPATGGSHPYDGRWKVMVQKHAVAQILAGNWQATCSGKPSEFNALVRESQFILTDSRGEHAAPVNSRGKFKLAIPLTQRVNESGYSDGSLTQNKVTFILTGSLQSKKGRRTNGIQQLGNTGCTAKVNFERV